MKKKTMSLTIALREYLSAWPAGEARSCEKYFMLPGDELPFRSRYMDRTKILRIVEGGFVTLRESTREEPVAPTFLYGVKREPNKIHVYDMTRTDKVVKPYVPSPNKKPPKVYGGIFPWPPHLQWRLMHEAPPRRFRVQLAKLSGGKAAGMDRDEWGARYRLPTFVYDRGELIKMRFALAWLFDVKGTYPKPTKVPDMLQRLMGLGGGIRAVLLDLLMEPVFDDGVCTGFVALDPDVAAQELEELAGNSGDLTEKYLNHMNSHGRTSQEA